MTTISNADRLSAGRKVFADKRRRKQKRQAAGTVQEIKWDDNARKEYLTGFQKRKQQRIKHAKELAQERERLERIEERKLRRQGQEEELRKHLQPNGEEDIDGANTDADSDAADDADGKEATATRQYTTKTTVTTVMIE